MAASGIDRVELEYLRHLLANPAIDATCVWSTPSGMRMLRPGMAAALRDYLSERWSGPDGGGRRRAWAGLAERLTRRRRILEATMLALSLPARRTNAPAFYITVSHRGLSDINRHKRRLGPHTRGVVLIHDLMPILHSQYYPAAKCEEFQTGLTHACKHADLVIANSLATAAELEQWAGGGGLRTPPVHVNRLAVRKPRFRHDPSTRPYFVFLGTLGERKNIEFLLHMWERIDRGERPRLSLIGSESESLRSQLARNPKLHASVGIESGLDDQSVGRLLAGARALLMPSLAEGFGLPVAEALAMGLPVVCNDLPVFREFGDVPEFIPIADEDAWLETILRRSTAKPQPGTPARNPRTWAIHVEETIKILRRT